MAGRARTTVPTPEASSTSSALDELTGGGAGALPRLVEIPLEYLHPHSRNPRRDLGDLTELAESIKATGIRQPLTVVPYVDTDGEPDPTYYTTVIGHRRAAAAALAGLAWVPAIVDESLTLAQQLELMLVENIQRADLSPVEEADGYQGLLDLGLDEAAIADKTGRSKATVHGRLQLAGLPRAAREKVHLHQATLDDAALLAKTLADKHVAARTDLVKRLEDAFGQGGFEWRARQVRDEAEEQIRRDAETQKLNAAGVRIVPRDPTGNEPKNTKELDHLTDDEPSTKRLGAGLTVESHATCPGHVAWFDWNGQVRFGCENPKKHGHKDRYATAAHVGSDGKTGADRKTLVANNRAAATQEPVRRRWERDWLRQCLAAGAFPADALPWSARVLQPADGGMSMLSALDFEAGKVHRDLVDVEADAALAALRTPQDDVASTAHFAALAIASVEGHMPKDYWRSTYGAAAKAGLLAQLASWGYEMTDLEREFAKKHAPRKPPTNSAAAVGRADDEVVTPDGEVLAGGPEILHEVDDSAAEDLEDDVDDEGDED